MENGKEHFRHILYYYFLKGKKASEAHRKLCAVYGDKALKERQCQNWFAKFRSGNFSVETKHRAGRPIVVNDRQIRAIMNGFRLSSTSKIAERLGVSHASIEKRLKQLGYKKKLGLWIPPKIRRVSSKSKPE